MITHEELPDICHVNPRQRRFVEGFVAGLSASQAYREAGYKAKGHAAESAASKLLRKPEVAGLIRQLRQEAEAASRMGREDLARYLWDVIFTPIAEVDASSPLVQEVTTRAQGEKISMIQIKMVPKIEAARQLISLCGWDRPEEPTGTFDARMSEVVALVREGRFGPQRYTSEPSSSQPH